MPEPMADISGRNIGLHPDAVFTYVAQRTIARLGTVRGERYPITHSAFYSEFKRAAAAVSIPDARVHDLRHTAVTKTLRATGNLVTAQRLAGHKSIQTTMRYAHLRSDDFRTELEKRDAERPQKRPHHVTKTSK
ncbi:MAG: tyrosine-type recombinase/integrase [Pseudomonadota bacterium]